MKLQIEKDELRPLVQQIVAETLAAVARPRATLGDDRLAYSEPEAADLIGVKAHVLRDARRRNEIKSTRIAAGRVRYTLSHLMDYLGRNES